MVMINQVQTYLPSSIARQPSSISLADGIKKNFENSPPLGLRISNLPTSKQYTFPSGNGNNTTISINNNGRITLYSNNDPKFTIQPSPDGSWTLKTADGRLWQLPTEFTERLSNPNELAKLASSPDEFEKFFNDNNEQVSPTGINSAKDDNKVGKKNPLKPLEGLYDQTAQNVSHATIGNQYNRERDGVRDFLYLGIYENYQYQYSIRRDPNTGELGLYLSGLLRKPGSDVATEFEEKVENPSPDLVRRVEAALNEINADAKKQIQHNRRRFEEIQRQFPEMK